MLGALISLENRPGYLEVSWTGKSPPSGSSSGVGEFLKIEKLVHVFSFSCFSNELILEHNLNTVWKSVL